MYKSNSAEDLDIMGNKDIGENLNRLSSSPLVSPHPGPSSENGVEESDFNFVSEQSGRVEEDGNKGPNKVL